MEERRDIEAAGRGDSAAFGRLVEPLRRQLYSFILRSVTHPADAEDILQETLLKAHQGISSFRGESSFKTWIFSVATHACMDQLRARKRWRVETQLECQKAMVERRELLEEAAAVQALPDFAFSVREHIAFCFSCVARILPPEQHEAVLLREVFDFSNLEAAKMLGLSESVFRHHLSDARRTMENAFDRLCSLVGKHGLCYQCTELRDLAPEGKRGEPAEPIGAEADDAAAKLTARLRIVREADLTDGTSARLHALFFRLISSVEEGRPLAA